MSLPTVAVPEGAPGPEQLAAVLSDYREFRCIGSGAMGVVYEAWHQPLERRVAVKVLSPALVGQRSTLERFFREARAMARISHEHIVQVFEVGGEGSLPYFAMELVPGGSLRDLLQREGPLPPRRAAEIAVDLARALAHAHREGILHRDVKPGNALLDAEGRAHLTDFGLVRRADSATLTATDSIVGTPQYMSPEQVRGLRLDGRGDQFSLGATLYEALTGAPPFAGENPMTVLRAICEAQPRSIRRQRPEIPSSLEAVVLRMLEKEPLRRYPDLEAAAEDLERYLRGEAVEATLPGPLTRGWRRLRANRLAWRIAVVAAVLGAVAAVDRYRAWLGEVRSNQQIVLEQVRAELTRGRGTEALAILEQLDDELRADTDVRFLEAQARMRTEEPETALAVLGELVEDGSRDARILEAAETALSAALDQGRLAPAESALLAFLPAAREITAAEGLAAPFPPSLALVAERLQRLHAFGILEAFLLTTPEGEALPALVAPRTAEDVARRAMVRSRLDRAQTYLRIHQEALGEDPRWQRERILLRCLVGFLERRPEKRQAILEGASQSIKALIASFPGDVEAIRHGHLLMQAVRRSGATSDRLQGEARDLEERYGFMLEAAQSAVDLARREVEKAGDQIASPSPSAPGPLGRASETVGGWIKGLFGG